ncbi:MAG TPA: hypothetical protein VGO35_06550 [Gammaproteobacteria bacterium]|jgi:hypothetical protein|nr:hypothetical protein [Gammaproteobacteria bacterium]
MLLSRIQRDLFDFAGKDPDDFAGLVEFWYQQNSEMLSAALTAQQGLNVIVNISEFHTFEGLSKRLFLLADTLIIRDTREWNPGKAQYQDIPIPTSGYKPGYFDEVIDELKKLKPSALTLMQKPAMYVTSTHKKLNNGYNAVYVGGAWNLIPPEFINWIASDGRAYMETGNVVYAPFIPPLEMELEFINNWVSLPDYFNATPFFHQRYEWLRREQLQALLALKIPFLDGLDIRTIAQVKAEHQDEFKSFSRAMLDSVSGVKAVLGTEGFLAEANHIQRNLVDAALADVSKTIKKIKRSETLRRAGMLATLVGLNGAALLGSPAASLVTGLGSTSSALMLEKLAQLKDQGELKEKKGYFLWKLQQAVD